MSSKRLHCSLPEQGNAGKTSASERIVTNPIFDHNSSRRSFAKWSEPDSGMSHRCRFPSNRPVGNMQLYYGSKLSLLTHAWKRKQNFQQNRKAGICGSWAVPRKIAAAIKEYFSGSWASATRWRERRRHHMAPLKTHSLPSFRLVWVLFGFIHLRNHPGHFEPKKWNRARAWTIICKEFIGHRLKSTPSCQSVNAWNRTDESHLRQDKLLALLFAASSTAIANLEGIKNRIK